MSVPILTIVLGVLGFFVWVSLKLLSQSKTSRRLERQMDYYSDLLDEAKTESEIRAIQERISELREERK